MATTRIDDLRRRVEADPASIAFAQLAEEYRRSGQTEEAVRVCKDGLARHPGYLSARVTLGRALLDLGQFDEAREELQFVAGEAPENLAAVRGLAEILHREGDLPQALDYYQRALALARHDPELEEIVQQLSRQVGAEASPSSGLSFEEAHQELLSAAERVPLVASTESSRDVTTGGSTAPFDFDKLVAALGTPSAPSQILDPLEDAVAPIPSATLTPVDIDGPQEADPFAALEAELRAREAELPNATAAAPELEPEPEPEPVGADHHSSDANGHDATAIAAEPVPQFPEVAEPSAAEPLPWTEPVDGSSMKPWPWESGAPEVDGGTAEFSTPAQVDVPSEPVPVAAPQEAETSVKPGSAGDDVLGDLEGWLDTLQSRSGQ